MINNLYKLRNGLIHSFGGGGSSGGGGGGSGVVDYPTYMKDFHSSLLDHVGTDTITKSLIDVMNVALGDNPFTGEAAYNPDTDVAEYKAAISDWDTILAGINESSEWSGLYTQAETDLVLSDISVSDKSISGITDAVIVTDSANFGNSLDNQIVTTVLPRFQRGMQDINAVVSSAFVVGESNIENTRDIEVAKHESDLRVKAQLKNADVEVQEAQMNISKDVSVNTANLNKDLGLVQNRVTAAGNMMQFLIQKYAWEEAYTKIVIEGNRIKIVAKKEEADVNLHIDESDASWDINLFQHGGNLLAGIGGGTVGANGKNATTASSVIGGAMSGAVAGTMVGAEIGSVGGPMGALIGGVIGAASGFL